MSVYDFDLADVDGDPLPVALVPRPEPGEDSEPSESSPDYEGSDDESKGETDTGTPDSEILPTLGHPRTYPGWDVKETDRGMLDVRHIATEVSYKIPASRFGKFIVAMDPDRISQMLSDKNSCDCQRGCISKYKFCVQDILELRCPLMIQPVAKSVKTELAKVIHTNLTLSAKRPWVVKGIDTDIYICFNITYAGEQVCPKFFINASSCARRVCYAARTMAVNDRLLTVDGRTTNIHRSKHGKFSKALAFWTWSPTPIPSSHSRIIGHTHAEVDRMHREFNRFGNADDD